MEDMKPRLWYLVPCCLTAALGFFNLGYCFGYFNTVTGIMHKQYVHEGKLINFTFLLNSRQTTYFG